MAGTDEDGADDVSGHGSAPPEGFDRLEELRGKTDALLDKALRNEISSDESRWIQDVHRLRTIRIGLPDTRSDGWFIGHASIAIACVVLAGLLMLLRVGDLPIFGFLATNNVSLHLRSTGFAATIAESPDPNIIGFGRHIATSQLAIRPLNTIAVSNTSLALHEPDPVLRVALSSEELYIDEIRLNAGALIDVSVQNGQVLLDTDTQRLQVHATFDNAEFSEPFTRTVESTEDLDIPLFARFESSNERQSNLEIRFDLEGPVSILEGSRISSLELVDRYVLGADTLAYISTIRSGSLILSDVGRTVEINNRDSLVVEGLQAWITDLTIEDGVVDLFAKGTVRNIRAGPGGYAADLSPRLLEYFLKNQPFTLFWGSMIFLWGLLGSIVKRVRGR